MANVESPVTLADGHLISWTSTEYADRTWACKVFVYAPEPEIGKSGEMLHTQDIDGWGTKEDADAAAVTHGERWVEANRR